MLIHILGYTLINTHMLAENLYIHIQACTTVICYMPCILKKQYDTHISFLLLLHFNTRLQFTLYFSVALRCTRNNEGTNTDTHKRALNGLLVGEIRDNKGSHKLSKNTRIRRNEEKRSRGARRAEEAETGSHRVM